MKRIGQSAGVPGRRHERRDRAPLRRVLLFVLAVSGMLQWQVPAARAEEQLFVPLFTYRTGAFANSGGPIADGMRDYLTMLNERDGGIGGVKLQVEECETGYDNAKGVACYEQVKGRKPVMINPWSTGIALQLIPKAAADHIPILSMGYGLSAAARGNTFPWVFNPPATYWDGLSMIIAHMGSEIGGPRKLAGLKLGYVYLDSGYGREPIALFQKLAETFGFELKLYPVTVQDMQKQSAHWKQVMADGRDYVVMFGWGAMNPTGVSEAINAGFPMTRLFSIWWLGEADLQPLGEKATGLKTLNWHNVGQNYPLLQDILKHVVDAGKSQVKSRDEVGQLLYNRGVYNSMLISEAIRNAQKLAGKAIVNGDDVRKGLETLTIDHTRLREIGLDGFAEPIALTCADHNGHRPAYIQQWHTNKWLKLSGRIQPMTSRLEPLVDAAEREYVQQNAPWPERTVPCEKPS